MRPRFICAFLTICLCVFIAPGFSQTITGTLNGTVTDPSGGVLPNVKVVATNVDTNIEYTATTNAAGVYNLLFLPVGRYNVSATASGFKKAVLGPYVLEVNQTARVDVRMEVGEVNQSIEVSSIAPILQTESTQTGGTITATQATALPLNGRNFLSLTLLVPGSLTPNPGSFTTPSRSFGGGRPYVNGNREQSNNFLLDGVDINEPIDDLVSYNPNVDALEQVQVLTGNAPAEFGNGNGAVVNMTLKSGTNEFHGDIFEFLRNQVLDANSFFNNRSGAKKRALRQNIFGGAFGGPIKKDKLFFFVDYQGTRRPTSGTALASLVPANMRTGDLSKYTSTIKDPTNGQAFGGNIIPLARIVNPAARALFADTKLYPLPNVQGTGPLGIANNYQASSADFLSNDQADAKIDYRMSPKDNLSGRMTIARYRSGTTATTIPALLGSTTDAPTTGGVINWVRAISASIINEARVGYNRTVIINATTDPGGIFGTTGNQKLGIPGGQPIAGASSLAFNTDGFSNVGGGASDSATVDNVFQYGDNFTYQYGRHTFKSGFQFLRYQQNRFYAGNNGLLGNFTYTGTYTGSSLADFLLDDLNSKGRGSQTGKWGHRQWRDAIFFQDDWKLRPNLTINIGLRWEYTQPVYEVKDREANIDLNTGKELFAGKDGNSRALYKPYYKQFEPRVGFAWTPGMLGNKFVVRAGYGITSFMEGTGANLRLTLNPPFFFESAVQYSTTQPGSITSGFTDVLPQNTISGQVRAWNPDLRPAFIQQWNLSNEYQFSNTFSLTVGYVGQKGTHLVDPREYNQPLPGVGPVSTWAPLQTRRPLYAFQPLITNISGTDSSSTMWYNGLQVSGRKRLSGGLEFIASYTLSRTLTDNLGYYGSSGVNAEGAYWQNAYDRIGDRGPGFFNALHNFSLGGTYDLPFGKTRTMGKAWNRATDFVLGGWTINYVASLHSGFPVTIQTTDLTNMAVRGATRPNRYGALTYSNQSIDNWFGTGNTFCGPGINDGKCAYGQMAPGTFGNSAKGTEHAPDFKNLDLGIGKKFNLTERRYFDFRAEFFNALNHTSFSPPARNIAAPASFGTITSTVSSPRNIEFALKFYF